MSSVTSVCISNCVNDARVPARATYVNLHKWPESDPDFMRTVGRGGRGGGGRRAQQRTGVVGSFSCRQMYLRSYIFSRKAQTVPEGTKKCLVRVRERAVARERRKKKARSRSKRCAAMAVRRVKELSCAAFCAIFYRLLSCTTSVDVVDYHRDQ